MAKNNRYDVIVIGSGIGGLTVASILAQMNKKRVLVLEQHFVLGGQTHTFSRRGENKYTWDVGLHYCSGLFEKGLMMRQLSDFITAGQLNWVKIPSPYDILVYPDLTFPLSDKESEYEAALIDSFPEEAKAIKRYLKDIKKVSKWGINWSMTAYFPAYLSLMMKAINSASSSMALMTTKEYLDKNFKNETLKSIVGAQNCVCGVFPDQSAFVMHAMLVMGFLRGGFYPEGGAGEIVKTISPIIERAGGKLIASRMVTELILEGNKAVGVKAKKGKRNEYEEYFAPVIISDTGARNTYTQLIPETINIPFREEIRNFPTNRSPLCLYLGLKESPETLGFKPSNYYVFNTYDYEELNDFSLDSLFAKGVQFCFISFPSLRDPLAKTHAAQVIINVDDEPFEKWAGQPWQKKDKDYYELKDRITEAILDLVESKFKGFRDIVDYKELSTRFALEFFLNREKGDWAGIAAVPDRYRQKWIRVPSPVKNLYLTGTDVAFMGIEGAMLGGVATAAYLQGPVARYTGKGIMDIFKKADIGYETMKNT